jgi:hypothetical protein
MIIVNFLVRFIIFHTNVPYSFLTADSNVKKQPDPLAA